MPERMLRVIETDGNQAFEQHIGPRAVPVLDVDASGNTFTVTVYPTPVSVVTPPLAPATEDEDKASLAPPPDIAVERFNGEGRQKFRFRLRDKGNGEPLAQSEGYRRKKDRDATAQVFADYFGTEPVDVTQ